MPRFDNIKNWLCFWASGHGDTKMWLGRSNKKQKKIIKYLDIEQKNMAKNLDEYHNEWLSSKDTTY